MMKRFMVFILVLMLLPASALLIAGCEAEEVLEEEVLEEEGEEENGKKEEDDMTGITLTPTPWVTEAVDAPRVQQSTFESEAAQSMVSYHIYLPELYDTEPDRKFPVLYWLHGGGGGLGGIGTLSNYFDGAISEGKIPPILVVFPYGMDLSMWVDSEDGKVPMETVVVKELVPHIDATYRTMASREGRLIEGFSMGGYGAARLGFKYHDIFGAVSMMGSGPLQTELVETPRMTPEMREALLQDVYGGDMEYFVAVSPRKMAEENAADLQKKNTIIRLVIGDIDETYKDNREFHEHLEQLQIPHEFIVMANVAHNPLQSMDFLGEKNWEFYRFVFSR